MYRYKLHKEPKKQVCPNPSCNRRRFVRYIDLDTNEMLPRMVGRCDREIECGYHLKPKDYFKSIGVATLPTSHFKNSKISIKKPSFHPILLVEQSGKRFKKNKFIQYLKTIFTGGQVKNIIKRYLLGSSNNWPGATVFWQIDVNLNVRGGKIMLYNQVTGKRIKKPYPHITWVHSVLTKKKDILEFNLDQCLFGLQLLIEDKIKPIAIVESEKTACIMSELFDKYIWLACGSLSNIKESMFLPLKARKIVLYPDISINAISTGKWSEKSKNLKKKGYNISVSTLIQENSSTHQQKQGLDIADFFICNPEKVKILSYEDEIFNNLNKKNPLLNKLVKVFDLTKSNGESFIIN